MLTVTVQPTKTGFDELIALAKQEPVRLVRQGCVLGVLVSAEDYEAMRNYYAQRLLNTLAQTGDYAQQQGLTEDTLAQLLADED